MIFRTIAFLAACAGIGGSRIAEAQLTNRVSLGNDGAQGNDRSLEGWVSADGRCIAFTSLASNLVPGDTNGDPDVFLRDRWTAFTERISVSSNGLEADNYSSNPTVSADGRFVAFESSANNLVPVNTPGNPDIFVRDRLNGTTQLVSFSRFGDGGASSSCWDPRISADGRFVAFQSVAYNLVPGDANGVTDIFVRDLQAGTTELVSVDSNEVQGDFPSDRAEISADGRYVSFQTASPSFVAGDTNNAIDVFVRDRWNGTTELVSVAMNGLSGNSSSGGASLSGDGRYVFFGSGASDLVPGDFHGGVFVRDRQAGTTVRESLGPEGVEPDAYSFEFRISGDGRSVTFLSNASNLVPEDTNGQQDAFVRDLQAHLTERVSISSTGQQGNDDAVDFSTISADGSLVVFTSLASNLVPSDTNVDYDVFEHIRNAPGFTSICEPGIAGVISCPCSNPPSGAGRGCDNSTGTGGAELAASGVARLMTDSLFFTTEGERATATSILLQGTTSPATGLIYGQGVRCIGGALRRLYTKSAFGGSIDAPDLGAGDLTVSARSAALGDTIQAGQSRWYLVFYRDPIVLGGCPATSTFNSTQTGRIHWSL